MSKRRKGFPSEARVKRGDRVVHGNKELVERLGRNDPCPCGSGRRFQAVLHAQRSVRRLGARLLPPRLISGEVVAPAWSVLPVLTAVGTRRNDGRCAAPSRRGARRRSRTPRNRARAAPRGGLSLLAGEGDRSLGCIEERSDHERFLKRHRGPEPRSKYPRTAFQDSRHTDTRALPVYERPGACPLTSRHAMDRRAYAPRSMVAGAQPPPVTSAASNASAVSGRWK